MMCFGLIVVYCLSTAQVDSFCQIYQKVIQAKGDGTITATPGAKRRILANELLYKQVCK